ncbi:outer membrane autotransporter barrel domain protein [Striga asiatica]|uniref:Outer membrane autotransporter barrel domain protein n=1 Tax=Striga asiatica TaxID=4170 RepID=A0A5A7NYW6_STRAF|nr:outer membrane autotransporter barrel domain protein [Striga asiatica]
MLVVPPAVVADPPVVSDSSHVREGSSSLISALAEPTELLGRDFKYVFSGINEVFIVHESPMVTSGIFRSVGSIPPPAIGIRPGICPSGTVRQGFGRGSVPLVMRAPPAAPPPIPTLCWGSVWWLGRWVRQSQAGCVAGIGDGCDLVPVSAASALRRCRCCGCREWPVLWYSFLVKTFPGSFGTAMVAHL